MYLRQSLDAKGEGVAVDRQRTACAALCAQKGWEPQEYVDNNVSASSRKPRPAYQRMLADIEAGRLDAVVVFDLDRLHRQPMELEHFIVTAERHKIALASATGDVDLATDNGRLFARIKGAVARAEVERKSARQKAAHEQMAAAGKPWSTRRPFGFEDDAITHRPTEAAEIVKMYSDFLAGVAQGRIARGLNERGILTSLGNQWSQNAVRVLLRNARNAGLRTRHGELIGKAQWDPIVPEEVWARTVSTMDNRKPHSGGGARKYLLTGVAKCGVCEGPIRAGYTNRGVRNYVCYKGHVGRNGEGLDELIHALVLARLADPDLAGLFPGESSDDTEALRSESDTLRGRLDQLAESYADGTLTRSQLITGTERIKARIAVVQSMLAAMASNETLAQIIESGDRPRLWESLDVARQRNVVSELMEIHILRAPSGTRFNPEYIKIEWK